MINKGCFVNLDFCVGGVQSKTKCYSECYQCIFLVFISVKKTQILSPLCHQTPQDDDATNFKRFYVYLVEWTLVDWRGSAVDRPGGPAEDEEGPQSGLDHKHYIVTQMKSWIEHHKNPCKD